MRKIAPVDLPTLLALAGFGAMGLALAGCPVTHVDPVDAKVVEPSLTRVAPDHGPATGGTSVVITGTNFHSSARVQFGAVAALNVAVDPDGSSISCTAPALPGGGSVDVTVVNPGERMAAAAGAFRYTPRPIVVSLTPNEGPQGGGIEVQAEVQDLVTGDLLTATLGGKKLEIRDASAGGFTFDLPPGRGATDLRVTAGDGQIGILTKAFRYVPPPRVRSVRPSVGAVTGGLRVTLTGAGFRAGAVVEFGGVEATDVVPLSDSRLTATVPAGDAGLVDVEVINPDFPDSISLPRGFEYVPVPEVVELQPESGPERGGVRVRVLGTGFLAGRTQVRFGGEVGLDATYEEEGVIEVTSPPGVGAVDVIAVHDGVASEPAEEAYLYVPPPNLVSVDPVSGPTEGGGLVVLTGEAFQDGAIVVFGDTEAPEVAFDSADRLVATTPPGLPGATRVRVRNPDGQESDLPGAYEYVPPPTVVAVTPEEGCETGGYEVVVAGRDFQLDVEVRFGEAEAEVIEVAAPGQLRVRAPAGEGVVDVRVTNPDGQTRTLEAAFTYDLKPRLVAVTPAIGPRLGGTRLTITGTCFSPPDTATLGGADLVDVTFEDTETLQATTAEALEEGPADLRVTARGDEGLLADAFFFNDGNLTTRGVINDPHALGATLGAVAADLDGDGRPDLALASAPVPELPFAPNRVLRNNGEEFVGGWISRLLGATSSIAVGDLDGDGLPDLWYGVETDGGAGSGANQLFRNLGALNFQGQAAPDNRLETTLTVAMADVDGDGDLDLLSAGFQGPRLHINEGEWVFSDGDERLGLDEPPVVLTMLAVDLDGDDDVDLLLATHSGGVILLRNDGRGIFRNATAEALPAGNPDAISALVAGDVDGDGDIDLVVGGPGPDRLWLQQGGVFADATADRLPSIDAQTTALALGDLDSDGDLDLIVGLGGAVATPDVVLDNDGQATFIDVTDDVLPDRRATRTQALVLVDVDGDGALDLYTGAAGDDLLDLD